MLYSNISRIPESAQDLLSLELFELPLNARIDIQALEQPYDINTLRQVLKGAFEKLSQFNFRVARIIESIRITEPGTPAILAEFFRRQGHTTPLELVKPLGVTYAEMGDNFINLSQIIDPSAREDEISGIDIVYVKLLEKYRDQEVSIQMLKTHEVPGMSLIDNPRSLLLNEFDIIKMCLNRLLPHLSEATKMIVEKSYLYRNEHSIISFKVRVHEVQACFQAKILPLRQQCQQMIVTDQALLIEFEQIKETIELYEASVNAFSQLLLSRKFGQPYHIIYDHVNMILPLSKLLDSLPAKIEDIKMRQISRTHSVDDLSARFEECEISKPPLVTHFERKKKLVTSTTLDPHSIWRQKLEKNKDVIQAIFTTKEVYPRELIKLVVALGGTYKQQKSGVGFSIPSEAQHNFPCSSSMSFNEGFHTPHKGRRGIPLSPDLVDSFKRLLQSCDLTPEKLWPPCKPASQAANRARSKKKKRR